MIYLWVLTVVISALVSWFVANRRINRSLKYYQEYYTTGFFGNLNRSGVVLSGDRIHLQNLEEGTSCWLGPSGISFSGPGEYYRVDRETNNATVKPGPHVCRVTLGIDHNGRASLKLFGYRESNEYLGDYEQAAEIGAENNGDVRFKLGREITWTTKKEYGSVELAEIKKRTGGSDTLADEIIAEIKKRIGGAQ